MKRVAYRIVEEATEWEWESDERLEATPIGWRMSRSEHEDASG